jgi:hypothetical protein
MGAAVIALGAIIFSRQWRNEFRDSHLQKASGSGPPETTTGISDAGVTSTEALQYKSKLRPDHRKPTPEETAELLRNTIIPEVRLEAISIRDALVELNRFASDAGIPPDQLKFVSAAPRISPDNFLERKLGSIAVRNIPLGNLLKYLIDNRTIRYKVGGGFVELRDIHTPLDQQEKAASNALEENTSGSPDPFAP